jgi:RimJ/RimL family protein N-acetyltransferase
MVHVLADAALYEYTGGAPPTLDQLRHRYDAQSAGRSSDGRQWWCNWIVTVLGEDVPVGYVQATVERGRDEMEAVISWVIRPEAQGRGLATEAARAMISWLAQYDVARFAAYIHPEHDASARVAAKLGLHRTAITHKGEIRWESRP